MSDPWNAAWEEAEATNPPVDVYHTLELVHPAFNDGAGVFAVRIVAGIPEDVSLRIEQGADLNGGELVNWQACEFKAEMPEVDEQRIPQCKISIDNVGRIISPYLANAVKLRANMTLTYRQYRADDIDEPCYGPVTYQVKRVNVSGTQLQGTAMLDDLTNRKFPFKVYTFSEFPGLLNS